MKFVRWINIYVGYPEDNFFAGRFLHETKRRAQRAPRNQQHRIDTVKVQFTSPKKSKR
jgi:hypothetical protein